MSMVAKSPGPARIAGSTFGWARRLVARLAGVLTVALIGALVAVAALMLMGFRPLTEQSDSMAPVLRAGDVLFVTEIPASQARIGDILTFDDAAHPGQTLTHRVVSVAPAPAGKLAFVTKGDANTGVEAWNVAPEGLVGRYAFRVPHAGRIARYAATAPLRVLVVLAALTLAADVLRRVWRRQPPKASSLPLDTPPTGD
jgi:signal peptidase